MTKRIKLSNGDIINFRDDQNYVVGQPYGKRLTVTHIDYERTPEEQQQLEQENALRDAVYGGFGCE